jgi:hypothetical protein
MISSISSLLTFRITGSSFLSPDNENSRIAVNGKQRICWLTGFSAEPAPDRATQETKRELPGENAIAVSILHAARFASANLEDACRNLMALACLVARNER